MNRGIKELLKGLSLAMAMLPVVCMAQSAAIDEQKAEVHEPQGSNDNDGEHASWRSKLPEALGGSGIDGVRRKPKYTVSTSVYTRHWNPKDEHNNNQRLIGIDRAVGSYSVGGALFSNSFHQSSQYIYVAREFRFDNVFPGLRSKVSAGLLHGYRGDAKNKIPFNDLGIAPIIIPTIGYASRYIELDAQFLGLNAVMVTAGIPFHL